MWLFTTQGFYSVVKHRRDHDKLLVRARVREDLDALRKQIPELRIFSDETADYRWRAVVTRAEWLAALAQFVEAMEYDNFKDAVAREQGPERAALYSSVWSVMRRLQGSKRSNGGHRG
jgi:hypothetical protein